MLKRNLVTSLLLYESVRTTKARAKAIQGTVDHLITTAKKKAPHIAIRLINRTVTDKNASRKILQVFAKRYADRPSGLTRIVPAGARSGDGAELVDITFVEGKDVPSTTTEAPSSAKATAGKKLKTKNQETKKPVTKKA
jgi:large subunit ribosomal protein L17